MMAISDLLTVGTKKEYNIHQPYETFSPTITDASQSTQIFSPQYTYGINIDSPNATVSPTKKDTVKTTEETEAKIEPSVSGASGSTVSPINYTQLGLIAAAAAVAIIILK